MQACMVSSIIPSTACLCLSQCLPLQVLEHAETVKKLSEQETHLHKLQLEQASHMASREEAYRSKVSKQAIICMSCLMELSE